MRELSVKVSVNDDMVVLTQLPPSGRMSNASIIEIPTSEWLELSANINKEIATKAQTKSH